MGFCFSTWASRIPDIKSILQLSEAELGTLLFALPIGQLIAMPISGRIVAKYGSHKISILGLLSYAICLPLLGAAKSEWQLGGELFLFGFVGNFCTIALNTQGVYTQQLYDKPIMGSFHRSWSLAGFFGALVGIMMLAFELSPLEHFSIALIFVILLISTNCKYIINVKSNQEETKSNYSFFKNPDKTLLWLGVICFCGMASGIIISAGLYSAILFPYLIPCTIAFMVVGFGVSNVVPIIFNVAGNNQKVPTGIALTLVSSISFIGFLIGPPLIGFIAELTSLKYSFAIIGIFGIFITVLVSSLKIFKS